MHKKKHDHIMYAYSDMACLHRHNFLSFQAIFYPFSHYWSRKLKFGKNVKNTWRYYSFNICIINQDHMIYGSWNVKLNRQNFFVILGNLLPLYPLPPSRNTLKNQNIKHEKNLRDIIILHKCTKNHDPPLHCSRDMVHDRCNCYFHFGLWFSFLPS